MIAAKYYFDKEDILGEIEPVEDVTVPLIVTVDIDSRLCDISF